MNNQLTIQIIKNTEFHLLYELLITDRIECSQDYSKLLSIAIIFLNSENIDIQHLGYRIILIYSNRTNDYQPLYEASINLGYIPIIKVIENKYLPCPSLFTEINAAFAEQFKDGKIYRSEQQLELYNFFIKNNQTTMSVVAPTSYGKTELILKLIKDNKDKNICVLTPTKSLLGQTKFRISKEKIAWFKKIVTQPEMYTEDDSNVVAVLTQERLLRLLKLNPKLSFDFVIIDEAHNLLNNDSRNNLLASSILILLKRNKSTVLKFLTPFLFDSDNLKIRFTNYSIDSYKITEYIKSEKIYIYDARDTKKLELYDQFLDKLFLINELPYDDIDFICEFSGENNIVYFNKPKDIEKFSIKFIKHFKKIQSTSIIKACQNIQDFVHKDYKLLDCLEHGLIYHHGSVPDVIRGYIEHLFTEIQELKYIVTSSTLLEGVNIPADTMFILDNHKGKSYLSRSNFKNLIGRICRFSEVFDKETPNLTKLEPEIYLVVSSYYQVNSNIQNFVSNVMKVTKKDSDEVNNILLENKKVIDSDNKKTLDEAIEFIENFESGTINNFENRYAKTAIGESCFKNNVIEINIFESEEGMQEKVNKLVEANENLFTTQNLFDCLNDVFLQNTVFNDDPYDHFKRFQYKETRNFYKMFLDWRIEGTSYREMIASFLSYWNKIIDSDELDNLVYVGKWGDKTREGFRALWVDMSEKKVPEKVNLAIVRIKEEQDFLDNIIIKYIEVLNDLGLVDETLYLNIKYGTSDKMKILLIKQGCSLALAKLLIDKYKSFCNIGQNIIAIDELIITEMRKDNVNEILIFELRSYV